MAHPAAWDGRTRLHDLPPLVWVEVPKAASTSLKLALAQLRGRQFTSDAGLHDWLGYSHASADQLAEWLAAWRGQRFRFTVVRHPVSRWLSLYHEKIDPHGYGDASAWLTANADSWWWDDLHAVPQVAIIGSTAWYDYIGRVEDMPALEAQLSAATGQTVQLPWANRTAGRPPRLTPRARQLLCRRYAADLEAFGYS